MKYSYEGIQEVCATFACGGDAAITEGTPVKLSANCTVSACASGDGFCGVVRAVSHDGKACSVALHGSDTLSYSGDTAPGLGVSKLAANGAGGVTVSANGRECLAVMLDTTAKTVTVIY